jgi:hypothetical protein
MRRAAGADYRLAPGRPKRELRSAQNDGTLMSDPFAAALPQLPVFQQVLERYCAGEPDAHTLALL